MNLHHLPFLLLLAALPTSALAVDTCDLAADIALRAKQTFPTAPAEGLRQYIQAQQLCPADPAYSYNLGMAYYRYGRRAEAADWLVKAVEVRKDNAAWGNNLAWVLLELGRSREALTYIEKAVTLGSNDGRFQNTLARALFATGKEMEALRGLKDYHGQGQELIRDTYEELLEGYRSRALAAIQGGREEEGLEALAALDFETRTVRDHLLVLVRLERFDDALAAVASVSKRFPRHPMIEEVTGEALAGKARSFYLAYRAGQGAVAVQGAKQLAALYPSSQVVAKAYEELLNAFLSEATSIIVPAASTVAPTATASAGTGQADALLAGIGAGATAGAIELAVDIEQKIPKGALAGPYDVAVIIGNRDYRQSGSPNVDYAVRGARTMRDYLIKTLGFEAGNILYAEDATLSKFNELFGNAADHRGKLHNYIRPGESRVFIYYAGHGAPDLESGDAYLVPVDANPRYLRNSGYKLQTFYSNLGRLPALDLTVVLDSCFSGNSAAGYLYKDVSSINLRLKAVQGIPNNAVVFASSQGDQVSNWYPEKRHSLFTYYFLKGIGGAADSNGDGRVTVAELEEYVSREVPYIARRKGTEQQPTVTGDRDRVVTKLTR